MSVLDEQALLEAARDGAEAAYCPYSEFPVGAAVVAEDGQIYTGANVENAAYGSTACAERVAIWSAVAAGARRILALAVVSPSSSPPCGPCRQVLAEFAEPSTPLICGGLDPAEVPRRHTLGALLPAPFTATDL